MITGSTRFDALPRAAQALTGRIHIIDLLPFKQASWQSEVASVGHWRTHDGHEVDLVIENRDGSVTAFEVKAASRVNQGDARGLRVLRDALGDAFRTGIVLTTGELTYRLDDRIIVAPIDVLWSGRS